LARGLLRGAAFRVGAALRVLPRLGAADLRPEGRRALSLADPRRAALALVRRAALRGVVDRRPRSLGSVLSLVSMALFCGALRWVVFFLWGIFLLLGAHAKRTRSARAARRTPTCGGAKRGRETAPFCGKRAASARRPRPGSCSEIDCFTMPSKRPSTPPSSRVGLVLAGGSARAAYEVGVVQYVLEDVARTLGRDVPIDVISGTSAGSINAVMLAAHADKPAARGVMLAQRWTQLELEKVVRPSPGGIIPIVGRMFGRPLPRHAHAARRGGMFDPSGIEQIVRDAVPFGAIGKHMRAGRLSALSISTTHVASGRTVVFIQRREGGLPRWGTDPTMVARLAQIEAEHALASAAVPLLFPAVEIDGQFYCDGGLRQNVPLSPARRLGADGLIVINPRYIREESPAPAVAEEREKLYPDPLFVVGKAMNALLLDRIENDIRRLQKLNAVLEAGTRRFGPGFVGALNEELGRGGDEGALRPLDVVYVRASDDIGVLAADYVRSAEFAKRVRGILGRVMRRVVEGESEADFLSYVMFDGVFAGRLIEIGRRDARARHEELVKFFAKRLQ